MQNGLAVEPKKLFPFGVAVSCHLERRRDHMNLWNLRTQETENPRFSRGTEPVA